MIPSALQTLNPLEGKWILLRQAINSVTLPGDFAEFGVYKGESAKQILKFMPTHRQLWLFDSFLGLPENWRHFPKGHFNTNGVAPDIKDTRVHIIKGWFKDTVPTWAKGIDSPLAFVHIDSDLYSSSKTLLTSIRHLLISGTIIQFDEIHGYSNSQSHEYKAWIETGLQFKWLCRNPRYQAALCVL